MLPPFTCCFSRSLSFVPIMGGQKGGQSSLDKFKKQKLVQVWRSISKEPEHTSKVDIGGSGYPIKGTINYEVHTADEAAVSFDVTLASGSVNSESCVESLEAKVIRAAISKSSRDSEIINRAGKNTVSIEVEAPLIRFVKGKWGLTQKQIEEEAGVKVVLPSAKGDNSVVIEGASEEHVNRALKKIINVLEQAVESPNLNYSHFISLPLAFQSELANKIHSFQKSVLEEVGKVPESSDDSSEEYTDDSQHVGDPNVTVNLEVLNSSEHVRVNMDADDTKLSRTSTSSALGIDSSIFVKPQNFHMTALMLKLWTKDRLAIATEVLKTIQSKVIDALENRPVSVRLRGVACMRGSPAKAYVLYAPVEEVDGEGRLFHACQVIIEAFVEAGLVPHKDAHNPIKFHATLMNARHRKRKNWNRRQESFDARGIFNMYGSEDWGEYVIPEAHLSQRFVFDESGYYHCCGSIPFAGSIKIE